MNKIKGSSEVSPEVLEALAQIDGDLINKVIPLKTLTELTAMSRSQLFKHIGLLQANNVALQAMLKEFLDTYNEMWSTPIN